MVEITTEKGKETEIRCVNCGKKLQTVEKVGAFGSKSAGFILRTKCGRCKKLNEHLVK